MTPITHLISWIGEKDLKGAAGDPNPGPIRAAIAALESTGSLQQIALLSNYPPEKNQAVIAGLQPLTPATITLVWHDETISPVDYAAIYPAELAVLARYPHRATTAVLLSPGTPQMQSVWLLLLRTRFPQITLLAISQQQGLNRVDLPFQIAAEFTPLTDQQLTELIDQSPSSTLQFHDIATQSPAMIEQIQRAAQLAQRDLPVLILGETGTGKELFARAIHNSSPRSPKPFEILNCGAIPPDLLDAELFGYEKGAFTGAAAQKKGLFEAADGGTLFLDELGELSLAAQVRLLRVLQQGTLRRVGGTHEIRVNVRIIAATHRDLAQRVQEGHFREDLLYRMAIGVLTLPPLREREGDRLYLAEKLLQRLAEKEQREPPQLSVEAQQVILNHTWPGNIRELENTLLRATLWQRGRVLTATDLEQAMVRRPPPEGTGETVLNRPLNSAFRLTDLLDEVERHYLVRAMQQAGGVKKVASQLLGYHDTNQTLNKRLEKYQL